jgi:hypothetical protein
VKEQGQGRTCLKHLPLAGVAVACTLAIVSEAHAQSSVTLYGIIDEGVNYTSNVQTSPGTVITCSIYRVAY